MHHEVSLSMLNPLGLTTGSDLHVCVTAPALIARTVRNSCSRLPGSPRGTQNSFGSLAKATQAFQTTALVCPRSAWALELATHPLGSTILPRMVAPACSGITSALHLVGTLYGFTMALCVRGRKSHCSQLVACSHLQHQTRLPTDIFQESMPHKVLHVPKTQPNQLLWCW